MLKVLLETTYINSLQVAKIAPVLKHKFLQEFLISLSDWMLIIYL